MLTPVFSPSDQLRLHPKQFRALDPRFVRGDEKVRAPHAGGGQMQRVHGPQGQTLQQDDLLANHFRRDVDDVRIANILG